MAASFTGKCKAPSGDKSERRASVIFVAGVVKTRMKLAHTMSTMRQA